MKGNFMPPLPFFFKRGNSMEENSTLKILKQAIMLEKRGKAFGALFWFFRFRKKTRYLFSKRVLL